MAGNVSDLNSLQFRKQRLLEDAEEHRLQLAEEWRAVRAGAAELRSQVKRVAGWASAAALLVGAVSVWRREPARSGKVPKSSWFQKVFKLGQLGYSVWWAFRKTR